MLTGQNPFYTMNSYYFNPHITLIIVKETPELI